MFLWKWGENIVMESNRNGLQMDKIVISERFEVDSVDYLIAKALINHVIRRQNDPVITYGDLVIKASVNVLPRNLGKYLGKISRTCKENNLPCISGIVVRKDTKRPGVGFYREFYKDGLSSSEQREIFKKCKTKIINCTLWKELLDAIEK